MEHKHSVYDTDTHFSIAKDTRQISLESKDFPVIVQHDHNSERFSFDLPRYIDGHDMLLCNEIQVHYLNTDSATREVAKGVYTVKDIGVLDKDENTAVCSWLISENATQYAGKLNFMIRFACLADDGTVLYRWNTGIYSELTVVSGYDNGEAVTEDFPDILAQWKAELFGVGDTEEQRLLDVSAEQQAAIVAEGQKQLDTIAGKGAAVLDSIPDEYEAVSALTDSNHRNKAGAIVLDADGENIVVNDASEYPLMGLKVFGKSEQFKTTGKNLVNLPQTIVKPTSGYNYDLFTGTVGVASTVSEADLNKLPVLAPGTYYFHVEIETAGSTEVKVQSVADDGTTSQDKLIVNKPGSFTLTEETRITFRAGTGETATIKNLQIEIGSQYTGYEPYTGGVASPSPDYPQEINSVENAVVNVAGKNLLKVTAKTQTANGITFTVNDDGTITINGTATAHTYMTLTQKTFFPVGSYVLSGCEGGGSTSYFLYFDIGGIYNFDGETEFKVDSPSEKQAIIKVHSGVTISNVTIKPMVRLVSVENGSYEPYTERTITIPRTLPGIPVVSGGNYTDANGQQWICDEVDLARGVYVQRTLQRTISDFSGAVAVAPEYGHTEGYLNLKVHSRDKTGGYCDKFPYSASGHFPRFGLAGAMIYFTLEGEYTKEEWVARMTALSPTIITALKDPIETPLSDAEITAFKALCTNKPTTTILNDAGAYMAVEYVADTKLYIDRKISELIN